MKYTIKVVTRLQDNGDGGYTLYAYNNNKELIADHPKIDGEELQKVQKESKQKRKEKEKIEKAIRNLEIAKRQFESSKRALEVAASKFNK